MTNMDAHGANGFTPMPTPFYTQLYTLVEPQELPPSSLKGCKTKAHKQLLLTLSRDHLNCLSEDKSKFPRNEVQLRFFNISGDDNRNCPDEFPLGCGLMINKDVIDVGNRCRPLDITSHVRTHRVGMKHSVKISWLADDNKFAVAVYVVRRVNTEYLLSSISRNASIELPYSNTEETIKKRLNGGEDDDVTMDTLRISLLCPLGKSRMKIAARSLDCTHIQCFDLNSYLQMNENRPKWKCCVCNRYAPFTRIIIDKYFTTMLKKLGRKVTDVELLKDGSFRAIEEKDAPPLTNKEKKSTVSTSTAPPQHGDSEDCITISDDDDVFDENASPLSRTVNQSAIRSVPSVAASIKDVDLVVISSGESSPASSSSSSPSPSSSESSESPRSSTIKSGRIASTPLARSTVVCQKDVITISDDDEPEVPTTTLRRSARIKRLSLPTNPEEKAKKSRGK